MKKILSIVLSAVMLISVFAVMPLTASAHYEDSEERKNDDFCYYIYKDDGYAFIIEYLGKNTEVVIPDKLDGYPVEKIGGYTFENCDFITKITLPDTIKFVQEDTFADTAFFKNEDNWENGSLYLGSILVAVDEEFEGEYKVKKGTTVIAGSAFYGCDKITKITVPGTVKHIPEKSFSKLESLSSVVFEEGVEDIDEKACFNTKKLEDLKLPKSIKRIGFLAFDGTEFYNNDYNWDNGALYYNNILISVDPECDGNFTVKDGTTVLGDYAFNECNVENIYLPDGIKTLPFAFTNNCLWLKKVSLGKGLEELKSYSLSEVKDFELPESLKNVGYRAFFQSKITDIKLPENLEEIGVEAFLSCGSLKEITIPKNVKKIGYEAIGYRFAGIDENGYFTEKYEDIVIKGYPGSVAETYAKENGFEFVDVTKEPEKIDISGSSVALEKDSYVYTGKAIEPSVTVTDVLSDNYSVEYKDNNNAGTAKVIITGKGNYEGSITKTFKISRAANPLMVKKSNKTVKYSTLKKKDVSVKPLKVSNNKGKLTFVKLSGNSKIKVDSKTGSFKLTKGLNKKTYSIKVKVTAAGNSNYKGGSKTVTVKIKVK